MKKELKHFKQTLKYLEKGYGTKVCKDFHPNCPNCQAQWAIGWMREHIEMLKEMLAEEKKRPNLKKRE